jgi:hypothetical protein
VSKPTKAVLRCLEGIQECADAEGWASKWPADIQRRTIQRCVNLGYLETRTVRLSGYGLVGWQVYRVTEAGRSAMPKEVHP